MAKKKVAETPHSASLIEALRFVGLAQNTTGLPWTRHTVLYDGMALGGNGVITAGHKIEEHLQLAPLTTGLIAALERCNERLALAELGTGLSVRSGKFKTVIPCHVLRDMPNLFPDPPVAALNNDALRAAFAVVGFLATDGAPKVAQAAVRLSSGSAVATNGMMLVEYWHGIDLPTILVPKNSVKAIEAVKKELVSFGCSAGSATFYFKDDSWIKTQLYNEAFPAYESIVGAPSKPWPVPPGFFDGLRAVKPFVADTNHVLFSTNLIHTHEDKDVQGAAYELHGIPNGHAFNINQLLEIESFAKTIDFGDNQQRTNLMFYGDNVRGCMTRFPTTHHEPKRVLSKPELADIDDDIPF